MRTTYKTTPSATKKGSIEKHLIEVMGLTTDEIQCFVDECINCMSFDHFSKKAEEEGYTPEEIASGNKITLKTKGQTYSPLIGDVCYRFKRESKEKFFKDRIACKIFLASSHHLRTQLKKKLDRDVLTELETVAHFFDNRNLPL